MRSRILWKLFLAFVLVAFLALLLQYLDLAPALRTFLTDHIQQTLAEKAAILRDRMETLPAGEWTAASMKPLADRLAGELGARVTIIATDGTVLGDSERSPDEIAQMDNHLLRPEVQTALAGGSGMSRRYSATLGTDMLYVARKTSRGFVRAAFPLHAVDALAWQVKRSALRSAVIALVLASGVALLFARSAGRSLRKMAAAAERIACGDFTRRLLLRRRDELGLLATSINAMAESLDVQFSRIEADRQQLQAILEGMMEGVLVTDGGGAIVLTNAAFQALLGVPAMCAGFSVIECVRSEPIHLAVAGVLADGQPREEMLAVATPRGEKHFLLHAVPLRPAAARSGCVAVLHDVTRLRELEDARREFVANVSHELKTPLTSILGFAETLRAGAANDPAVAAQFLGKIEHHAHRLRTLIDEVLKISEIESGRMQLAPEAVDVRDLAQALAADMAGRLAAGSLAFENSVPERLAVHADHAALRQILGNLLDNAIKYTPAGGRVGIRAEREGDRCRIDVFDTGIGIPAKDLPHIFERFYRVDRSRTSGAGGAGLGLAIVKHLVQAHGGEVHAESREGEGSRFSITLPLASAI